MSDLILALFNARSLSEINWIEISPTCDKLSGVIAEYLNQKLSGQMDINLLRRNFYFEEVYSDLCTGKKRLGGCVF